MCRDLYYVPSDIGRERQNFLAAEVVDADETGGERAILKTPETLISESMRDIAEGLELLAGARKRLEYAVARMPGASVEKAFEALARQHRGESPFDVFRGRTDYATGGTATLTNETTACDAEPETTAVDDPCARGEHDWQTIKSRSLSVLARAPIGVPGVLTFECRRDGCDAEVAVETRRMA